MLFYKVVEIKQKSFARGYMTATDLQNAINQWANSGWTLDRITSAETQAFLHAKDVFLLIFKKNVEIPEGLYLMINNQSIPLNDRQLQFLKSQNQINHQTPAIKKGMNEWQHLSVVLLDLAEVLAV